MANYIRCAERDRVATLADGRDPVAAAEPEDAVLAQHRRHLHEVVVLGTHRMREVCDHVALRLLNANCVTHKPTKRNLIWTNKTDLNVLLEILLRDEVMHSGCELLRDELRQRFHRALPSKDCLLEPTFMATLTNLYSFFSISPLRKIFSVGYLLTWYFCAMAAKL